MRIFVLIGFFGAEAFMRSQTSNEEIIRHGVDYLSICCIFSFGIFIQITFEKLLQSTFFDAADVRAGDPQNLSDLTLSHRLSSV